MSFARRCPDGPGAKPPHRVAGLRGSGSCVDLLKLRGELGWRQIVDARKRANLIVAQPPSLDHDLGVGARGTISLLLYFRSFRSFPPVPRRNGLPLPSSKS